MSLVLGLWIIVYTDQHTALHCIAFNGVLQTLSSVVRICGPLPTMSFTIRSTCSLHDAIHPLPPRTGNRATCPACPRKTQPQVGPLICGRSIAGPTRPQINCRSSKLSWPHPPKRPTCPRNHEPSYETARGAHAGNWTRRRLRPSFRLHCDGDNGLGDGAYLDGDAAHLIDFVSCIRNG